MKTLAFNSMKELSLVLVGLLSFFASDCYSQNNITPPTVTEENIVDITNQFAQCWGKTESVTHCEDGTLTYISERYGGLVYAVGNQDWTGYAQVVFELKEPSPCVLKVLAQYTDAETDQHSVDVGTTVAFTDMALDKRKHVKRVVLQTDQPATLVIKRVYLVKEPEYGEQKGQLRINELMQSNIDCIMDDLNDFPDSWVELYNSGPSPVNLTKYKLGLTPDAATAWQLPLRTTLEPGSYLIVYCDKVGDGLHTDFRLDSGKGGSVYLFFNGEVDDKVEKLKKQPAPNIAYGRKTETSDQWGYQHTPTPSAANCGTLCTDILPEPLFSEAGRVFTEDAALQVALSLPDDAPEGAVIRYTTDGSEPTAQSEAYTQPLAISSTTTVRAKAFRDGYLSPRSTTQSYIFLGRDMTLPVISLVTDQRYWDDKQIGILSNNDGSAKNDWRRPANIEYFEVPDSPSELNQLIETRVGGSSSRNHILKTLIVYANKRFGTKRLEYEFFPDQRPGITDFKSLMLRNAGSDFHFLYMRDAIIQRTMAAHTDLDWQAWRPAIVFKNGVYKGMLNIRERSNEDNIYTHYDGLEDIDLIENWYELKEGDWQNYNAFEAFYTEEGHTMVEYSHWMDVTEFSNLMLTHLYYDNLDFPANNFVMWRPRTGNSRWRFIVKDTDYGLGFGGAPADNPTITYFYTPSLNPANSWWNTRAERNILFRNMMDNPTYRQHFIDRAAVYMGDFMNERGTRAVWAPMYERIKTELPYHSEAVISGLSSNYENRLNKAHEWLSQRTDFFYQHLADFYHLGEPTPATINSQTEPTLLADLTVTINDIPLTAATFDGKFFVGQELTVAAENSGNSNVSGWEITQVNSDGSKSMKQINGTSYSFTMPSCESLSLQVLTNIQTAISSVPTSEKTVSTWHTLDGRRLTSRPIRSGLYLYGGRKIVVK